MGADIKRAPDIPNTNFAEVIRDFILIWRRQRIANIEFLRTNRHNLISIFAETVID